MADAVYRIEIHRRAAKDLRALSAENWRRVRAAIDALALDPRPSGCRKLSGDDHAYRIRVGEIRILYEIRDQHLLVIVVRAAHRRDVYRKAR